MKKTFLKTLTVAAVAALLTGGFVSAQKAEPSAPAPRGACTAPDNRNAPMARKDAPAAHPAPDARGVPDNRSAPVARGGAQPRADNRRDAPAARPAPDARGVPDNRSAPIARGGAQPRVDNRNVPDRSVVGRGFPEARDGARGDAVRPDAKNKPHSGAKGFSASPEAGDAPAPRVETPTEAASEVQL